MRTFFVLNFYDTIMVSKSSTNFILQILKQNSKESTKTTINDFRNS